MDKAEFEALKTWYTEWVQIPKYVSTASLAFLAFSLTTLLPTFSGPPPLALRVAWVSLALAAALASCGLIAAYVSLDLATRIHLAKVLEQFHMHRPDKFTRWISRWGKVSYRATIAALVLLAFGSVNLVAYVFSRP